MIFVKEVEEIHQTLIDTFGGAQGIRDHAALDSALARPFQTFNQTELHPTALHKSAALIESILVNYPFIDGNKRTGYVLMRIFLLDNGLDIRASQNEKYAFVIVLLQEKRSFDPFRGSRNGMRIALMCKVLRKRY